MSQKKTDRQEQHNKSGFVLSVNLGKVAYKTPEPKIPKKEDDVIIQFIETWDEFIDEDGVGAKSGKVKTIDAKKYTDPRGISVNRLEKALDKFLHKEKVRLFRLKKKYRKYPAGTVFWVEINGKTLDELEHNTSVEARTLGEKHSIYVPKEKREFIPREDWTVSEVVFYRFTRLFQAVGGRTFYDRITQNIEGGAEQDEGQIGEPFSGAYVILSRQAKYVDLIRTVIHKAREDKIDYVYLDFLAVTHAHKEIIEKDSTEGREVKEHFVRHICPYLVASFDKVYLHMDDWKNPSVFTRGWCVYEMYHAFKSGIDLDIVYSDKVLTSFQKNVEFDNDYFSYHDTASSIFTVFQHFTFKMLQNGSKIDNEIIINAFKSIEQVHGKGRTKSFLSKQLTKHFKFVVVQVGNYELDLLVAAINEKDYKKIAEIVSVLRKCGFFLKRINSIGLADQFYYRCRKAMELLPMDSIDAVFKRSKNLMNLYFDDAKCFIRRSYSRMDDEKKCKESRKLAMTDHKLGLLQANLAQLAFTFLGFYHDFEKNRFKKELNEEETKSIQKVKGTIEQKIVEFANTFVQKLNKNETPSFKPINVTRFLDNCGLSKKVIEVIVQYSTELRLKHPMVQLIQADNWYTKYLVELAAAGIDLEGKFIEVNMIPQVIKDYYNKCLDAFNPGLTKRKGPIKLTAEIFMRLDHVNILSRSKDEKDKLVLIRNLTVLEEIISKYLEKMNDDINNANNKSTKDKVKDNTIELLFEKRKHLQVAYALTTYELAKFTYKNNLGGTLKECLQQMKEAEELLNDIKTDRARSLKAEVIAQQKLLQNKLGEDIDAFNIISNGPLVTSDREFSFEG